ncbi:MAG: hypothetical protein QE271_02960 [Bacteriovoracaceae bacterium]|nr:hypothetical protein [Bacteriovoracaceae bacterium]
MNKISILKQYLKFSSHGQGVFLLLSILFMSILSGCFLDSATNRMIPVTSGRNGVTPDDSATSDPDAFPIQADRARIVKNSFCACNNLNQNLTPRQACRMACAKLTGLGNFAYATYQLGNNYRNKTLAEVCGGGNTGYKLCRIKYSADFTKAPNKIINSEKIKFLASNVLAFTLPQEYLNNDARNQLSYQLEVNENQSWRPFSEENNAASFISNAYGKANFIYTSSQFVTLNERMSVQSYIVPKTVNDPNCAVPLPFSSSTCAHTIINNPNSAAIAFYYATTSNFASTQLRKDELLPTTNNYPIRLLSTSSSNTTKIYDAVGSTSFNLVINELTSEIKEEFYGYTGTPNSYWNTYFRYLPAADSMGENNNSFYNEWLNPATFFPNPVPFTQNEQNPIVGPATGIVDNVTIKGVYLEPIPVAPSVFGNGNKKACPNRELVMEYDNDDLNAVNYALGNPVNPDGRSNNNIPPTVNAYPFYYLCRRPIAELAIEPVYDPILYKSIEEFKFKTVSFKLMSIEEIRAEVTKTSGIKYELKVGGLVMSPQEKNSMAASLSNNLNAWSNKIEELFITSNGNLTIKDAFGNEYLFIVPGSAPNLKECTSANMVVTDPTYGCYFQPY